MFTLDTEALQIATEWSPFPFGALVNLAATEPDEAASVLTCHYTVQLETPVQKLLLHSAF